MPPKLRIAVITHAIDTFGPGYMFHHLLEAWVARGVEFEVSRGPDAEPPDADLAILHIDMTKVGDEYTRYFNHYPLVINSSVRDISKSAISDQILARDDRYQGAVIVKTDLNFGGMRELRARFLEGDPNAVTDIQRPWRKVDFLPAYPMFNSPDDVPPGVWRNPNLVVEKFRPERNDDGEYSVRMWIFLGDRGIYHHSFSAEPIVKGKNTTRRIVYDVADVPEVLRQKREEMSMDYGKFDFGLVDGEVVLFDANRTPTLPPRGTQAHKVLAHLPNLSEGLDYYFRKLQG
jgi:hypothetical protein